MESKRQKNEILRSQLDNERSTFLALWRDLGDFVSPRRVRWTVNDGNKGDRRNQKIIDSSATLASRTLRSGMMGGVTSPARPWFRLTTPDLNLAENEAVKSWLHETTTRMSNIFLKTNLYNALPNVYGDMGTFGTAAMMVEEDFESVMRFYVFPIGSYMIANNDKLKVDVFFREFRMTVRQLIDKFGVRKNGKLVFDNFSTQIKSFYERGEMETWVDVCHVIRPNEDYDPKKLQAKYKKYSSVYYERGISGAALSDYDSNVYLKESGYDFFPVLCPRWGVTGEDVYGTDCPAIDAIGDIKQLQLGEKRAAKAIDKKIDPAMVGPTSMRNQKSSILPGDITFVDEREGQKGFRPAHQVDISLVELENKQEQIRQRISRCFYEDLFLMLAQSDRRQITAREIDERHEEKLLALGPVLEQLNQDLLDPLIDIAFEFMMRQGLISPPPQELQGVKLKVEYTSIMAQAQKLIGISSIERFATFTAQLAQVHPDALMKINADELIDAYGTMLSIVPGIIRTDEQVQAMRQQQQQAQAQQQQMNMIQQGASAAKDMSESEMDGENVLTNILRG